MKNKTMYIVAILSVLIGCKNQMNSNINTSIIKQRDTLTINQNIVTSENSTPSKMFDSCIKCNNEAVKEIKDNIDNLKENQVYNFLCCIHESCATNVEFTEFSNEVLYLLLYKKPELALKTISLHRNVSLSYLKRQLENPINDKIDVNNVYKSVEGVRNYEAIKKELLSSIQLAIDKYN